jgi:hypothetical protein
VTDQNEEQPDILITFVTHNGSRFKWQTTAELIVETQEIAADDGHVLEDVDETIQYIVQQFLGGNSPIAVLMETSKDPVWLMPHAIEYYYLSSVMRLKRRDGAPSF